MILVFASAAIAAGEYSADTPNGPQPYQAPPPVCSNSDQVPDDEGYTSPVIYNNERPPEGPETWERDWGEDILIHATHVGSNQDIALDEDTGDLYAIFDTDHSTMDSCIVYRSQDSGYTWTFWRTTYRPSGPMYDPMIEVVRDSCGMEWVCMFFRSNNKLWMRRMTPDQGRHFWELICPNDVDDYDIAGEADTAGWVYVTYVPAGTKDVRVARNALSGDGWVDDHALFTNTEIDPYPAISCATGGLVSVVFSDARMTCNTEIRHRKSTDYGFSFSPSEQITNNTSGAELTWTDMAYTHNSSMSAAGWIFTTFELSGSDNLSYYYTIDTVNWTYGGTMPDTGNENMPSIYAKKSGNSVTLAYNSTPGDSTLCSWTTGSNPTDWPTPIRINDYPSTGYWPSAAAFNGSFPTVLYTSYSEDYNCFLDWLNNSSPAADKTSMFILDGVSVTISPNPFTDFTSILVTTLQSGNLSLKIYDIAGRLIDIPVNRFVEGGAHSTGWTAGENLSPGVYFCVLTHGGKQYTQRMVLVR